MSPFPYRHMQIGILPPRHKSCDPKIIIPNPDTTSASVQDSSLNFYSSLGKELQTTGHKTLHFPLPLPIIIWDSVI